MKKSAKTVCIRNGRIVDPSQHMDQVGDLCIRDGVIVSAGPVASRCEESFDASGLIVMPGIVDMHVHLREPGREDKETVDSGTRAALHGGVTSVLAMPNTLPAIDSVERVRMLSGIIEKTAHVQVYVCASMTKNRQGAEPVDIGALKAAGAVAVSDDGDSVDDERVMEDVLLRARKSGVVAVCHCEDKALSARGVVNRGFTSTRMGVRGISRESEYLRVERDIALAGKTGAAVHIAHVSCKESVAIVAHAKKSGIRVTAETAPHYISLSEEDVWAFDPCYKMNPPLRSRRDCEALREAVAAGVIDVIASDHAPHTENEKEIEFERAEFGVIGLETSLSVAITHLISSGILSWPVLVERLCWAPARILGVQKGTLSPGADADIALVDPEARRVYTKDAIVSQSRNSPFIGKPLQGHVVCTWYRGAQRSWAPPSVV